MDDIINRPGQVNGTTQTPGRWFELLYNCRCPVTVGPVSAERARGTQVEDGRQRHKEHGRVPRNEITSFSVRAPESSRKCSAERNVFSTEGGGECPVLVDNRARELELFVHSSRLLCQRQACPSWQRRIHMENNSCEKQQTHLFQKRQQILGLIERGGLLVCA